MSESDNTAARGRHVSERVGFYMWRGGIIFCVAYGVYEGIGWIVDLILALGVPIQIAFGIGFLVTGFGLLVGSIIVERVIDARAERGLRDL